MPTLTLTTDFGLQDGWVAAMKGVIRSSAPELEIIDVSHLVPPQDILWGGVVLDQAARWFPVGTLHLAVVDPGVGTTRDILIARAGGYRFIAPDNGLLTLCLERWPRHELWRLTDPGAVDLPELSDTFHGRDRFAPLAAALVTGRLAEADVAERVAEGKIVRLQGLSAELEDGALCGRVLYADRFGNLVTNVSRAALVEAFGPDAVTQARVRLGSRILPPICRSYEEGASLEVFAIWGSEGRLELSITGGSAEEWLAGEVFDVIVEPVA